MFLKTSLKKTLHQVKKHKWLFLALFFTQLLFIIAFFIVQYKYQVAVAANFKDILTITQGANYNTTQLQAGMPFIQNTFEIIDLWEQLKSNVTNLLFFSFITFIIFNGFN